MKKLLVVLLFVVFSSLILTFNTRADTVTNSELTQPDLPQTVQDVSTQPTQQISSPQFYSESSTQSFEKGIAVGFAVGLIIGGVIVWFYKRRLA